MENLGEGYIWNDDYDFLVKIIMKHNHSRWNKYVLRIAIFFLK